jgi:hypothetical protein
MNIIIRFCIVKKFQKLETQLNLHAKQKFPKGSQFFCPKKKKLSYKIIDHWYHPTFPKGLQQ